MRDEKTIQGLSVKNYAYQWINGGCLLHQWVSGGRGIDDALISYVLSLYVPLFSEKGNLKDIKGMGKLLRYLYENNGAEASKYIPDEDEIIRVAGKTSKRKA